MRLTENEAIQIAKEYQKKYPSLTNVIKRAQIYDIQKTAWLVTAEFEQFGETHDFLYVVSDKTGEVEYTFNEHGTRDPHL